MWPMLVLLRVCEASSATFTPHPEENAAAAWYESGPVEAVAEAVCTASVFAVVWAASTLMKKKKRPAAGTALKKPRKTGETNRQVKGTSPTLSAAAAECETLATSIKAPASVQDRVQSILDAHGRLNPDTGAGSAASSEDVYARLVAACLRSLASERRFAEALELYDRLAQEHGNNGNFTVRSVVLWCFLEEGHFDRFESCFEKICSMGVPSAHDFINLVRFGIQASEQRFQKLFTRTLSAFSQEVQLSTRNRALSMCVAAHAMTMAQVLVDGVDVQLDIVAYNMLMKGYANVYDFQKCFDTYAKLRHNGMEPTRMTLGILMDACVDANKLEAARKVFGDLKQLGLELNVVLCTTFIKGLVNAGELEEARTILEDMSTNPSTAPDLVTFSILIKGHAEQGDIGQSMALLDRMLKAGVTPDFHVYHAVLTGCSVKALDPEEPVRVCDWLVSRGLEPNTATISVLMKAFSVAKAWPEAIEALANAHARWNTWPEARIFMQLAQACARANDGYYTLMTYIAMVKSHCERGMPPSKAFSNRLFRLCSTCGAGPVAARIHQAVMDSAEHGVELQPVGELMDVIVRKLVNTEQF